MFDPTSRYAGQPLYAIRNRDGRTIMVVSVPDAPDEPVLGYYSRRQGERLDHLAYAYLQDPSQGWRICELADAMIPDALAEVLELPHPAEEPDLMGLDVSIRVGGTTAVDLSNGDQVEVVECIGEPATYRLRYQLVAVDGDFPLLVDSRLAPGAELAIAVETSNATQVLVKGQVYGHRTHFHHGVADSWTEVLGGDGCMEMDRTLRQNAWKANTITSSIAGLLGDYQVTADVHDVDIALDEATHLLVQADTDLRFLRRLARRYGCWFWLTTDVANQTTAHFKRPPLTGTPVLALAINNSAPNVAKLELDWDVERPSATVAQQLGLRDKGSITASLAGSVLPALGATAFADIADVRDTQITAPVDLSGDLQARSEGALIDASWFVRLRGQTSKRALGDVLRSHTLVKVTGLGSRFSGTYVVASVRHTIDAASHAMDFELVRNAWGIT